MWNVGSVPDGRALGGGQNNPLQYSCLENPMDRETWQATVHRISKSRTWLKRLSTHARMNISKLFNWSSIARHQFSSVAQLCPTLCDSMNRSTPGLPVHHQLPEFTQTHVHRVSCHPAISSSVIPFSSCPQSLPASGSFPISQLFAWGGQSIGVTVSTSVLPMNT